MPRIHWQRLFLGGLLAGFVDNLLQFTVNRLYLFRAWDAATGTSSLPLPVKSDHHLPLALMIFFGNIFAVWLYAMMRVRLGPGPKTSALAGSVYWLMSWLFPVVLWTLSGPFPALPFWLLATYLCTHLGSAVAATMLGAFCYEQYAPIESEPVAEI